MSSEKRTTYEVTAPVDRKGKTRWIRVGTGWGKQARGKHQISLVLDSLPLPHEWEGKLVLFEQIEEDGNAPRRHHSDPGPEQDRDPAGNWTKARDGQGDGDIPF